MVKFLAEVWARKPKAFLRSQQRNGATPELKNNFNLISGKTNSLIR